MYLTWQVRRVLGGIVLKPHHERSFMEIAFCVVRKEEQRNGVGSRRDSFCSRRGGACSSS